MPGNSPHQDWIRAYKGGLKPCSNFEISGPFTEMVLLGNVALHVGQTIEWNSAHLTVTNVAAANHLIKKRYRHGWQV